MDGLTLPGSIGIRTQLPDNGSSRGEVTNAKLRLLEARLMGESSFAGSGLLQPPLPLSRAPSGVLTVNNGGVAARTTKGTSPGGTVPSNVHITRSSPTAALTPPMQVN